MNAFPNLTFRDPMFLTFEPRSDRLYVATLWGFIHRFVNDPATTSSTVFLDLSSRTQVSDNGGLQGLAFHPEFGLAGSPNRGYVYVFYQYHPAASYGYRPSHLRLSRFTVADGATTANPASELVLIQQFDPHVWHPGGGMFFGTDGFLHLSLGDAGGINDAYNTAQRIDLGFFSGVLRIDVDQNPARSHPIRRQPGSMSASPSEQSFSGHYFIPNDNPFLDPNGSILEEFWALGLRNPHRMTQDPVSGRIWLGDVGEAFSEEINIVVRGGNYQWPFREGLRDGNKPRLNLVVGQEQPPFHDYPHGEGNNAIIGGYVYRGSEHAALLDGMYLFGDNGSGRIWALDPAGGAPSYLCNLPPGSFLEGLSSFGVDANREVYLCKLGNPGRIYKLTRARPPGESDPPSRLSETGLFTDLATLTPAAALLPYRVNSPLWSDAANKRRWLAVPNDGSPYGSAEVVAFSPATAWGFPAGTVFIKHFDLPIDETDPTVLKRLETRLLVRDANGGVYGLTYKWRADGSDADLLAGSVDEDVVIRTATGTRTQAWSYPSRQACLSCHTPGGNHVLGVNTRQLNGDYTYPGSGVTDNQLRALNRSSLFAPAIDETRISGYDRLVAVDDPTATPGHRARSYLDANCAHCHNPGGTRGFFDARYSTPLDLQGIVDGPVANSLGIASARVIAPRDVARSILHSRVNTTGENRMPPLARNVVDLSAVRTLEEWIGTLIPGEPLPAPWSNRDIGGVFSPGSVGYQDGRFTVRGSGTDIWGSVDSFHFMHQAWTGDGEIIARVMSVQNIDPWAKAGVMFRESLAAGARNVVMLLTPGNGVLFQRRDSTNATTSLAGGTFPAPPVWVKLVRSGSTFTGSYSTDGVTWRQGGAATIELPPTIYVGLAVTSHNAQMLCTATFENVSLAGGGVPVVPVAPGNLLATASSSTLINLTWTDNSGNEDEFKIERSTDEVNFTPIATVAANVTSYANTGLTPSTTYTYRIRAARGSADSPYSNTASVATPAAAPPAPGSLLATAVSATRITLTWIDNSTGEDGFEIERASDSITFAPIALTNANATSYGDTSVVPGTTYTYRVRARQGTIASAYSNPSSASTSTGTANDWFGADIGSVGPAGGHDTSGGTVSVHGAGADIWDAVDAFRFYTRSLTGDGELVARVTAVENTDSWAKAGVMMRASLSANAPNAFLYVNPSFVTGSQHRTTVGGSTSAGSKYFGWPPAWVKIVRVGDVFTSYRSHNGVTWTEAASATIPMPATIYVGLATTSHNNAVLCTGVFDNVTTTGVVSPTPPAAPTNLIATAVSASRLDLAWTDNAVDEDQFKIERSADGIAFTPIAIVAANMTSYSNTGLAAATTYTYRVRASRGTADSTFSNPAAATTTAASTPPPPAPTNLIATAISAARIDLAWTDTSAGEDGFKLERSPDGVAFTEIALIAANTASYSDTGLAAATTFTYRVRATQAGADSSYSNVSAATTQAGAAVDWSGDDVGSVGVAGSHEINASSMTVRGSGRDIWDTADAFRFVHRRLTGDGEIVARVTAAENTDPWAKAGVMMRASLNANAANAFLYVNPTFVTAWQQRATAGGSTLAGTKYFGWAPAWVKIVRAGQVFTGYHSPNGLTWTEAGSATIAMPVTIYLGLAVTSHNNAVLSTGVFDNVSSTTTTSTPSPAAPANLSATAMSASRIDLAWADNSANETAFEVERSLDNLTFTPLSSVAANTTAYSSLSLAAATTYFYRVRALNGSTASGYTNAASATTQTPPASPPTIANQDAAGTIGVAFHYQVQATNATSYSLVTPGTLPTGLSLTPGTGIVSGTPTTADTTATEIRASNSSGSATATLTTIVAPAGSPPAIADQSAAGTVGAAFSYQIVASGATSYAATGLTGTGLSLNLSTGLITGTPATAGAINSTVTATNASGSRNATLVVTITAAPASEWVSRDIGAVAAAGSSSESGGVVSVRGSGADIWDRADEFHYRHRSLTGDGEIVARITGLSNTHAWAKAGVMFRESLVAPARHVIMAATSAQGVALQARLIAGGDSTHTSGSASALPRWVRLVRTGNSFAGYDSINGTTWNLIGTHTLALPSTLFVGLAVTSHADGTLCTATFDSVRVTGTAPPPPAPPNPPTSLAAATASSTQIDLAWTDASTDETGFQIERSTDNLVFTLLTTTGANATTHASTGLTASTDYFYRIRAINTAGASAYSNTATARTLAPSPPPAPPNQPTSLAAAAASSSQIDLTWTDASTNETGFQVEWSTDNIAFTLLATTGANATTHASTGLAASTDYFYRIRAINTAGVSAYSNTATARTLAPPPPPAPPNPPTSLAATAASSSQIDLTWIDASANETGFQVEWSTDNLAFTLLATTGANVTTYASVGLTASTQYFFRVRAVNGNTTSTYSNAANATTSSAPAAPTWSFGDIGAVGTPGANSSGVNTVTISGAGSDIWGTADAFRYVYRSLTGDGVVEARVMSMENTNSWAKAGAMIRETLSPGARNVFAFVTPAHHGVVAQLRASSGGETSSSPGPLRNAPHWVRVRRVGNTFTTSASPDSVIWTTLGVFTVPMGPTVLFGFAVTSHDNRVLNTVVFADPFVQ